MLTFSPTLCNSSRNAIYYHDEMCDACGQSFQAQFWPSKKLLIAHTIITDRVMRSPLVMQNGFSPLQNMVVLNFGWNWLEGQPICHILQVVEDTACGYEVSSFVQNAWTLTHLPWPQSSWSVFGLLRSKFWIMSVGGNSFLLACINFIHFGYVLWLAVRGG